MLISHSKRRFDVCIRPPIHRFPSRKELCAESAPKHLTNSNERHCIGVYGTQRRRIECYLSCGLGQLHHVLRNINVQYQKVHRT